MEKVNENVIEWFQGDEEVSVTACKGSKIRADLVRLAKKNEEIKILVNNKDGSIFAHVPEDWILIRKPMAIKEKDKENRSEKMKKINSKKVVKKKKE